MKNAQNNSSWSSRNDIPEPNLGDSQLDQILKSADVPDIERRRRRRLNRSLEELLGGNRTGLIPGPRQVLAAAGMSLVSGVVVLVLLISDRTHRTPEMAVENAKNPAISIAAESGESAGRREIVSQVVWIPAPVQREQRLVSDLVKVPFEEMNYRLNRLGNSEFGLRLWESAAIQLDSLALSATESGDPDLRYDVGRLLEIQRRIESGLMQRIQFGRVSPEQKLLAFRKLCRCGSTRSQSLLWKYWGNEELEPDLVVAAKRIGSAQLISQMFASTSDTELKVELMTTLLERGDDESVGWFLDLTARTQQFAIARESGRRARKMPTEKLVLALQGNRMSWVRAASMALARVDDPAISRRLVELARSERTRHAAILALTARQDDEAARFVRLAAGDLRWTATIVSARRKWNRLLAIN